MVSGIRRRRWVAKKLARHGIAVVAATLDRLTLPVRRQGASPHVLTYHRFGNSKRDPFCVPVSVFEKQMRWLAERDLAVSVEALERFVSSGGGLPTGAVVVTMDDGCRSVYTQALPVLRTYGIPAVVFVPAGTVGARATTRDEEDFMGWDELTSLVDSGLTVGSHAFHHRSLARMSVEAAREEVMRSRALLEQRLGIGVTTFAYPFGTRRDFNDATAVLLREAGYRTAFTSQHGAIARGMDALTLPRIKVEGGDADWMFALLCSGALDAWLLVDRLLFRLQG